MDLSQFDTRQKAEQGVAFPLEIDGETVMGDDDKPITFTLKGIADEDVHKEFMRQQRSPAKTPEEVREADMRMARAAVSGWSGNFTVEGEKVEFARDNIPKVFANPVVRAAVLAKVFDRKAFMKGS